MRYTSVMHQSDAYSSTSYSRGIRWLPSPEIFRMIMALILCRLQEEEIGPLQTKMLKKLTKVRGIERMNPYIKQANYLAWPVIIKVAIAANCKGVCLQNTSKPHSHHLKIWPLS